MTKKEIIEYCNELLEANCSIVEVFEWIEDNTDLDPAEILHEIM